MGQLLNRMQQIDNRNTVRNKNTVPSFPDLDELPPEIGITVLSHLDATNLCLAACVWQQLASDEILWQGLCHEGWRFCSAYQKDKVPGFSYRKLYLLLDEGTLTFNADPNQGLQYLLKHGIIEDNADVIALFLHSTKKVYWRNIQDFLRKRSDVLDRLIQFQNFKNQFLPNALRKFFRDIDAPNDRGTYLHNLIDMFAERFVACNPHLGLTKDSVFVVCFSLILLSVDLSSPQVKNKMSKREFIRNTRNATTGLDDEFVGHLYDNIYLIGHVAKG